MDASSRLQFLWNASHTLLPTVPSLSAFYMQQFNQFAAEKELNLAEAVKRKYCSYCGSVFLPGLNSQVRVERKKKRKRENKKKKSLDSNYNNAKDSNKEVISVEQPEELNASKQINQEKNSLGKRKIIYIYPSNHNNNPKSSTTASLLNSQKQKHAKRQHHKNHVSYTCNSCNRETRFAGSIMRDISSVKQQKGDVSNYTPITNSSLLTKDKTPSCKKTKKKQKKMQLQQLLAKEKRKSSGKRDDFNDSPDGLILANFLSAL